MEKKKTKTVSARITEYEYQMLKKSRYTVADAISIFIRQNLRNPDEELLLKYELARIEKEKLGKQHQEQKEEVEKIEVRLHEKGIDPDLPQNLKNSIVRTVNRYQNFYNESMSFEDFVTKRTHRTEVLRFMDEELFKTNLTIDEYSSIALDFYENNIK